MLTLYEYSLSATFSLPELTKKYFAQRVQAVKEKLAKTDCDLLLWVVSSHGGLDQYGPYFVDSNQERIYQYPDWINKMAAANCAATKTKKMIFFPTYCRNFSLSFGPPPENLESPIALSKDMADTTYDDCTSV